MIRRSKKEYGIWDLTQKFLTKAKFMPWRQNWDHFWDFVVIFTKMKEKTCNKGKKRCHNISHFKIYLTVRKYDRAREYQRHAHDTLCMSK